MMQIILTDVNEQMVNNWQSRLKDISNVSVQLGSILDIECDAVVSPANSFGFMDGGIDMAYSRYFGWHVQDRLQKVIHEQHHGELLIGMAEVIETDNDKIPYLIAAPTMRVPMILDDSVNPYLAMRAVILLIKNGHFADGKKISDHIRRIAVPGFGTGVGRVKPSICAHQMIQAIRDFLYEKRASPVSWFEASERHQLLYTDKPRDLQYPKMP